RLVRVLVDREDGVNLDDVAALSHHLSEVLDSSEAMGDQPYVLEVSSPGVDRPLTLPRHWRRSIRRLVNVELADGHTLAGRITAAHETSAVVATDSGERSVEYSNVAKARIEVEFTHRDVPETESTETAESTEQTS
ncbi:MAG: ribosome maturation factor RimP, partial [Candidatus Nanopelagicales bacterium]